LENQGSFTAIIIKA